MKITSRALAYALHDSNAAPLTTDGLVREAFAQYLLDHPASITQHRAALTLLGLRVKGPDDVRSCIAALGDVWDKGTTLHRALTLRHLAEACAAEARRIQHEQQLRFNNDVAQNGGVTEGLWVGPDGMALQKANLKPYLRSQGARGEAHPKHVAMMKRRAAEAATIQPSTLQTENLKP